MTTAGITLILGGARSGKSSFAERLALESREAVTYLATADCRDGEMKKRIELHRERRPAAWKTWEGRPEELPGAVASSSGLLLLDCLTMWLTRLFLAAPESEGEDEAAWFAAEQKIGALTRELCESVREGGSLIIVSNEVGFGLVPPYLMGRRFRDMQGRMNQLCAGYAANVALVVAGCPLWIKGGWPGR
ncbi:MAG: bifunctional adenosylcobinamide kinase/adenosylcobinamide-phosphate guanylyltransferase [Synergistaceae bacterium]|nr:bifunctional adenosylcobinamide kinase/adenosylcobinamide-phosphate guanylyltransferase [Synergistaceae bacterium]